MVPEREAFLRRIERQQRQQQEIKNAEGKGAENKEDANANRNDTKAGTICAESAKMNVGSNKGTTKSRGQDAAEFLKETGIINDLDCLDPSSLDLLRKYRPTPNAILHGKKKFSSSGFIRKTRGKEETHYPAANATVTGCASPPFNIPEFDVELPSDGNALKETKDHGTNSVIDAAVKKSPPPPPDDITTPHVEPHMRRSRGKQEEKLLAGRARSVMSTHKELKKIDGVNISEAPKLIQNPLAPVPSSIVPAEARGKLAPSSIASLLEETDDDKNLPFEERIISLMLRQNDALRGLEAKVDALTKSLLQGQELRTANAGVKLPERQGESLGLASEVLVDVKATRTPVPAGRNRRAQGDPPRFLVFSALTSFTERVKQIVSSSLDGLRATLSSTKVYRIMAAAYREAVRQNVHANLDLWLLLKLIAVVAIFGGRASSRRKSDVEPTFFSKYRTHILFAAAIFVYLLQTGIVGFVYKLVRDLPRLLKEDDVANANANAEEDGEVDIEPAAPHGGQQQGRPNGPLAPARDRDENEGNDGAAAVPQEVPIANGPRPEPAQQHAQTRRAFTDGGIRRGGGLLHDVKFLLGSFVLSLIPTWRPTVDREEPPQQVEGEVNGAAEGLPGNDDDGNDEGED